MKNRRRLLCALAYSLLLSGCASRKLPLPTLAAITLQGLSTAKTLYRTTRDALGAVVTVEAGCLTRAQVVSAGYSFLSSGSKSLFFGLGDRNRADRVTIRWPSGKVSELKDVAAGKPSLCEPPGEESRPPAR